MIRKYIHTILLIFSLFGLAEQQVKGQEFPWTMQYLTNMHTINPAYVGMYDQAGFMLSTRKDYVSIEGSTLFQQFSYHTPIKDSESGIGFNLINRNVGIEKQIYLTFDYSYQIRLDMYYYLRFGFRAGVVNYSNNLKNYHLFPDRIPDPEFASDINMYFMTVFGVGAVIFNDDYYIGLSIPQYINNSFKVNRSGFSSLQEFKTIYLSTGYVFKLPMSVQLRPNILVIGTVGKPVYFDLGGVVYLPNNLQFGLNYRSNGATCFSGQYSFGSNLKIGFAADYALFQDIRKFQFGTYEILVGYDFNIYRKNGRRPSYF